jgi:uncharacterized protein DUF4157
MLTSGFDWLLVPPRPRYPGRNESERPLPVAAVGLPSAGRLLEPATRAFMEPRLGRNFSEVRIHTDDHAARSAAALGAPAYTIGRDIAFGPGRYAPETSAGRELLAHELAHVRQQAGAEASGGPITIGRANDAAETEAATAARAVMEGGVAHPAARRVPASVQRAPPPGGDELHQPMLDRFREEHGLPPGGVDPSGERVGPSDAELKYHGPNDAAALATNLQSVIAGATWKEIRKRVYPKESAPGIGRARERKARRLADLARSDREMPRRFVFGPAPSDSEWHVTVIAEVPRGAALERAPVAGVTLRRDPGRVTERR